VANTDARPRSGPEGFDYSSIPEGFYHEVMEKGNPIRRAWHLQKFERIIDFLPRSPDNSILDVGCFAGTFLSLLSERDFGAQMGVDIIQRQIDYANRRFATPFRSFRCIRNISELNSIERTFTCVTVIEVIEHLHDWEIRDLFRAVDARLEKNGLLVLSTPNYASHWPLLEILVNYLSEVSYEEQHVTKFNYFSCVSALRRLSPEIFQRFELVLRTTSHFLSPFLAAVSFDGAMKFSRLIPHRSWKNPFGCLLLLCFQKK
jgi:2-polyprenyl-3-methyl-5-hydroxy-6-metoxy-1,4-benzoquinol methylase